MRTHTMIDSPLGALTLALTGFSGGLARKRFLLDLERPAAPRQGQLF
ncbi:hypothetical protein [Streptosporangium roseum]